MKTVDVVELTWMVGGRRRRGTAACGGLVRGAAGPWALAWIWLFAAGCAGPGPKLMPVAPFRVEPEPGGGAVQWYDTTGDGKADYAEALGADGRIARLLYDAAGDGAVDEEIDLRAVPPAECRDLILILDSVPYPMVTEAWEQGRLRLFPRPSRVIAPFPVMTDVSLVDFFGMVPGVAPESAYYDGRRTTSPYDVYLQGGVAVWHERVDFFLPHLLHGNAYLDPEPWFGHELRRIQEEFATSDRRCFIAYCVGTSALGAIRGRTGHQLGLVWIDRFCREMTRQARGRVRITLLSDHGHNLVASRRIPLSDLMRQMGYRVDSTLAGPGDAVVPEFAMVTCAAVYTRSPERVAGDVLGIQGIELSAFRWPDGDVIVLSRDGRARISRRGDAYRYECLVGDPLDLQPVIDRLKGEGRVDSEGFVEDRALFEATVDHELPDAVHRLWRAFNGLFRNTPDVLIGVADGWHCGSAFQSRMVQMLAAHGNLAALGSGAFSVTTAGGLPPVLRMEDLGEALRGLGVPVPPAEAQRTVAAGSPP